MSIGPLNTAGSIVGSHAAQTGGSAVERAQREVGAQRRQVYYDDKAEVAGGVGEPDGEEHQPDERTADGRRPWEEQPAPEAKTDKRVERQSKDPSQQSGNFLDATG